MFAFLLALWKHRKTPTIVEWDDTNMPYTPRGQRQEGAFIAKSLAHAWVWGQVHTFFNPRGAAYLMLAPHTA